MRRGGVTVKCGNEDRYAFCDVNILFKVRISLFNFVNMSINTVVKFISYMLVCFKKKKIPLNYAK